MIGILCNKKNENVFVRQIHALLKSEVLSSHSTIIVFSIENVDLNAGIVFGSAVSKDRIKQVETVLPDTIFNLSVQHKSSHIKKLRGIIDLKVASVINASNLYNQSMIMDMLSADERTRKYILPYSRYSIYDPYCNIPEAGILLLKPENKPNLSKISITETFLPDIVSGGGDKKWLCLKVPELIKYEDLPIVARIHLQRRSNGEWVVLKKSVISESNDVNIRFFGKIEDDSLKLVRIVHCFITHLDICYIDFIFDIDGNPFLLNFGGYDAKLLKDSNEDVQISLYKNIMEFARGFINKPDGEFDYVD